MLYNSIRNKERKENIMKFQDYLKKMHEHFGEMTKDTSQLFEINVDKDELWDTYLESFAPEYNKIFRERREHDCSCCRSFIKRAGNVVVIKDNKLTTLWDFNANENQFDKEYQPVINAMSEFIKSKAVSDIFITKDNRIGTPSNKEMLDDGKIITWNHLFLDIPRQFVDSSSKSEGDLKGSFRDIRNVFKRSLDELTIDSVETVLELIYSNTLYKGEEWKRQLESFLEYKKEYMELDYNLKDNYVWEKSAKAGAFVGKIRNNAVGTLLINISEGMDLDLAVRKYETIVAPSNYKRPKAIYTPKMLEDAKQKLSDLGYMDSLKRRHATLDDITINNILFADRDSTKRIIGDDIFGEMSKSIPINVKKFSKADEISIGDFINNVLPTTTSLEILLENKHSSNLMSLIAPQIKDSKSMFKWNNNFSWAYSGNVTDSMKELVKSAGGKVDGDLRFSIQWNDIGSDTHDLDAHCIEPNKNEIYYGQKLSRTTKGVLDVDIQRPSANIPAVENITWASRHTMQDGNYVFFAKDYSGVGFKHGFRAEIEFDGQIYSFDCHNVRCGGKVEVAKVNLKNGIFTISETLKSSMSSKEIWGLNTNQFAPVSVISYSPNYWDEQNGIGNKHYFFMLKDCINSESPNGFYNEFLNQELNENRKVMEALGSKLSVEAVEDQLSGLGFSSTMRNEVIVKVKGKTERVLKIKF
jgi:hypothetical protein